jgi:hypothetical protein
VIDPAAARLLAPLERLEDACAHELEALFEALDAALGRPTRALAERFARTIAARMDAAHEVGKRWQIAELGLEAKSVATFTRDKQEFIGAQGGALIARIDAEQRARVQAILAEASRLGLSPAAVARDLAKIVPGIGLRSARDRAEAIARTELHNAATWAAEQEALRLKQRGADLVKVWTATMDFRTRPAHRRANGQVRELHDTFSVGGTRMSRPGDPRGGVGNVARCRCIARHLSRAQIDDDRGRRAASIAPALTTRVGRFDVLDARAAELDPPLAARVLESATQRAQGRPVAVARPEMGETVAAALQRVRDLAMVAAPAEAQGGPAAFLATQPIAQTWSQMTAELAAAMEPTP